MRGSVLFFLLMPPLTQLKWPVRRRVSTLLWLQRAQRFTRSGLCQEVKLFGGGTGGWEPTPHRPKIRSRRNVLISFNINVPSCPGQTFEECSNIYGEPWTLCSVAPLSHTGSGAGIFFFLRHVHVHKTHILLTTLKMKNLHLQPANELPAHLTPDSSIFNLFFGKMCAKVVCNSAVWRQKVTVPFPGVWVMAGCKHKANCFQKSYGLIALRILRVEDERQLLAGYHTFKYV